jgi:hypothetical protein
MTKVVQAEARTPFVTPLSVAVAGLISLPFALTLLPQDTFDSLIHEDGVVEWIGAIGLFCASGIFFVGFLRARKSGANWMLTWSLLGLALLFFFGGGEEISWGQRVIGWGTPDALDSANGQDETNLHNLGPVQNGSPFLRTNALFAYFWITFAVLMPLAVRYSDAARRRLDARLPVFPLLMAPLFLYNQVLSQIVERGLPDSLYHGTARIATTVTEIRESNFSVLFALAALLTVAELSSRRPPFQQRDPAT